MTRTRMTLLALVAVLCLAPLLLADTPADNPNRVVWSTAAASDTDIFGTEAQPEPSKPSTAYRLSIALVSTDSVVNVAVTRGVTVQTFSLNAGTALTAGSLYTFTFGAERSDTSGTALTYNVRCATATTVGYASMQEVRIP